MPVYQIDGKAPVIGKGSWIAPSAEIIGDVTIGRDCYIGFGAVIRGDFGSIRIGDETLVEENVVIHTAGHTEIGSRVIIGHMAMIHDAVIQDSALIGMKSMICEGAFIGKGSIVAEQTLVRKNQQVPAGKIIAGSPGALVRDVEPRHEKMLEFGTMVYLELIRKYHKSFQKI